MLRTTSLALFISVIVILCGEDARSAERQRDGYAQFYELSKAEATQKARVMAEKDFAAGKYRLFVYGLRRGNSPHDEYLKTNYGVDVTPIAGCVVSPGIMGAADGYNSTMRPLLQAKFGRDIFAEARQATETAAR